MRTRSRFFFFQIFIFTNFRFAVRVSSRASQETLHLYVPKPARRNAPTTIEASAPAVRPAAMKIVDKIHERVAKGEARMLCPPGMSPAVLRFLCP